MIFVDTNCFLRFLLGSESEQQKKAIELFQKASLGQIELFTSIIVIFEIYWVLSTFYQKDKKEVKEILANILKMEFIHIKERTILQRAIARLDEFGYDLEDSYNFAYAIKSDAEEFMTFDQDLGKKFKNEKKKV